MKKLCFLLIALFTCVAANAWTVTFKNTDNWEKVYIYAWISNDNIITNTWPGTEITNPVDNVYTFTLDGNEPKNVIFNAGQDQPKTADLPFVDGGIYTPAGLEGTDTPETEYTVYYTNPNNWATPYAYVWNSTSDLKVKAWPGEAMTQDGNKWVYTFKTNINPDKIKFAEVVDGSSKAESANFDFEDGKTYGEATPEYIYIINNANWATVYVYYWPANKAEELTPYRTKAEGFEYDIYRFDYAAVGATGCLAKPNSDNWDGKTGDFKLISGAVYETSMTGTNPDPAGNITDDQYKDIETGVASIFAGEGEAAYFNMQGVKVANPENGLFIKVVNGKASKVLVK